MSEQLEDVMPKDLAALIRKNPKILKLLHDNGIHFCAGCFLTLTATPARAAAYHGVPDIPRFVRAVERVVGPSRRGGKPRHAAHSRRSHS